MKFKKYPLIIIIFFIFIFGCTDNNVTNTSKENRYISKHKFEITYPKNWHLQSHIESYDDLDVAIEEYQNNFYIFSYNQEEGLPGNLTINNLKIVVHIFNNISLDIDEWIYKKDGFEDKNIVSINEINMEKGIAKEVIWESEDKSERQITIFYKEGADGAIFIAYPFNSNLVDNFYQIMKSFKFN